MNRFKSKKGFTLAELLIVVAIIAVLVAVAVPLFVGALSNANTARDDANIRAVRSAAVAEILLDEKGNGYTNKEATDGYYVSTSGKEGWYASAEVDNQGNVSNLKIYTKTEAATETSGAIAKLGTKNGLCEDKKDESGKKTGSTIYVRITELKTTA